MVVYLNPVIIRVGGNPDGGFKPRWRLTWLEIKIILQSSLPVVFYYLDRLLPLHIYLGR